jgi:hypothetical protein
MSWLNALASLNTAQVPHAPQSNTKHTTPTRRKKGREKGREGEERKVGGSGGGVVVVMVRALW